MKICVCNSIPWDREPRGLRHALWLKRCFPDAEIVLVEIAPKDYRAAEPPPDDIEIVRHNLATRESGLLRTLIRRIQSVFAIALFQMTRLLTPAAIDHRVIGLTGLLKAIEADVYYGHTLETWLPCLLAAQSNHSKLILDCMEAYGEMGESQSSSLKSRIRVIENRSLPKAVIVTANTDLIAAHYRYRNPDRRFIVLENVPEVTEINQVAKREGISLYWRNAVLGFGQRGLDDLLIALQSLPPQVTLVIQGRLPTDGGQLIRDRIDQLGLNNRITIAPPHKPGKAIEAAAAHHIGLCLEQPGILNHELTTSNKLYDYLMAGLVVVCSQLPGLARVVSESNAGVCFKPGDPDDLAKTINRLISDPERMNTLATNARQYALSYANRDVVFERFRESLVSVLD